MKVLPIKFLTSYDKPVFGEELISLAHLQRLGMPVRAGWVVLPPADIISKVKKSPSKPHLQSLKEKFRQNPQLEELMERIKDKKVSKRIWEDLVDRWFLVLEQEMQKNEQSDFKTAKLRPETVYLTDPVSAYGTSYVDKQRNLVEIEVGEGELSPEKFEEMEKIIRLCNSKLLLDYIFEWILEGDKLMVVRLKPYTQNYLGKVGQQTSSAAKTEEDNLKRPTAFKLIKQNEIDQTGWILVGTPKDLLGMAQSEDVGNGFIVDLDKIYYLLSGEEETGPEAKVLNDFFSAPLKEVIKKGVPVYFRGKMVEQDGVLKFLIKIGVTGAIFRSDSTLEFEDYIRQLEHLHVAKLLD